MARRSGISRAIDDAGRLTVPKEIRDNIHIKEGDYVDFHADENDNIIIKRQGYSIPRKIQNITEDVEKFDSESPVIDMLIAARNKFISLYGNEE